MVNFKDKFYVTAPIFYNNAKPTIGTIYVVVAADILARYNRLKGRNVFFLTGMDENSQRVIKAAAEEKLAPKEYCDKMAQFFIDAIKLYNASNDDFIRTTEQRHRNTVQEFTLKVNENRGDIYKGKYEGYYCENCEEYLAEGQLENGLCPIHLKRPKKISEENYFFKLSRYQDFLLDYLEKNPKVVEPEFRKNEIISFIKQGLHDLSITRPTTEWGIPFPLDKNHVFYIWFDALLNYLTACPKGFWPPDLHLVGKEIQRFHYIIWFAMLKAAGYEPPQKVFSHGWLTFNGQKIGKSGVQIDPIKLAEKYSVDAIRYYLFREIPFGNDGDISELAIIKRINEDLANDLGNLLHRTLTLIEKNNNAVSKSGNGSLFEKSKQAVETYDKHINALEYNRALDVLWAFIGDTNRFINERAPWKLTDDKEALNKILFELYNSIALIAFLCYPFIPSVSEKIFKQLGLKIKIDEKNFSLAKSFRLIKDKQKIGAKEILFKKIELSKEDIERIASISKPPALEYERDPTIKIPSTIVEFNNLNIQSKSQKLERIKKERIAKIDLDKIEKSEIVQGYWQLIKEGRDKGNKPSPVNLVELVRKTKTLPQINTVVDCYNLVSLETGIVMGAYDRKSIKGKLRLKLADGSEFFIPSGSSKEEKIIKGEYVYVDEQNKVITRLVSKQAAYSTTSKETKNVVMCIQGNNATTREELLKTTKDLCGFIQEICGGEYRIVS